MYRNFIEGASPRGIGVGYPENLNICFDANALNIVMTWHGAFMDGALSTGTARAGVPAAQRPLHDQAQRAQAIAVLPDAKAPWPELKLGNNDDDRAKGLRFRGYRLVEGRRPVFKYTASETVIEDYVIPEAGALPAFTRQLTLTGSGKYYYPPPPTGSLRNRATVGRWARTSSSHSTVRTHPSCVMAPTVRNCWCL